MAAHPHTYADALDRCPVARLDSTTAERVKHESRQHFAALAATIAADVARLFPPPVKKQNREGCEIFGK